MKKIIKQELDKIVVKDNIINEREIDSLINYIVNIYYFKYQIIGDINYNYELHLSQIEKRMTDKQINFLKNNYHYPYIEIKVNNNNVIINIDPITGKLNNIDELKEKVTEIKSFMKLEDILYIIEQSYYNYDIEKAKQIIKDNKIINNLKLRVINYISEVLKEDIYLKSSGEYRSNMFIEEISSYYNIDIKKKNLSKKLVKLNNI